MVMKWEKNYLRPVCLVQVFLRKKIRITTISHVPKKSHVKKWQFFQKVVLGCAGGGGGAGWGTRDEIKELIENWRRNLWLAAVFLELTFMLQRHW